MSSGGSVAGGIAGARRYTDERRAGVAGWSGASERRVAEKESKRLAVAGVSAAGSRGGGSGAGRGIAAGPATLAEDDAEDAVEGICLRAGVCGTADTIGLATAVVLVGHGDGVGEDA
jgi:hypothetical protein